MYTVGNTAITSDKSTDMYKCFVHECGKLPQNKISVKDETEDGMHSASYEQVTTLREGVNVILYFPKETADKTMFQKDIKNILINVLKDKSQHTI